MLLIEEVYFGWKPVAHAPGCAAPVWDDAEVRHSEGGRPVSTGAEHHTCPNDVCGHTDTFTRVQLRLLCRDCQTVTVISGESLVQVISHTAATGWGQPPTAVAGVWLWPGRPVAEGAAPYEYLVTLQSQAITRELLYGVITSYLSSSGVRRWMGGAVPDKASAHLIAGEQWRYVSPGLASLDEAAAWIADAETRARRPLVVDVR